jgi:hypothetical protein
VNAIRVPATPTPAQIAPLATTTNLLPPTLAVPPSISTDRVYWAWKHYGNCKFEHLMNAKRERNESQRDRREYRDRNRDKYKEQR